MEKEFNKDFVPYQPSLDMKELGFDEPCLANYNNGGILQPVMLIEKQNTNNHFASGGYFKEMCTAPLYQQAFRWFRDTYKLHHQVTQYYGEHFFYKIEDMVHPRRYEEYSIEKLRNFGQYSSQEEAELEGLKHLIRIVKENANA